LCKDFGGVLEVSVLSDERQSFVDAVQAFEVRFKVSFGSFFDLLTSNVMSSSIPSNFSCTSYLLFNFVASLEDVQDLVHMRQSLFYVWVCAHQRGCVR